MKDTVEKLVSHSLYVCHSILAEIENKEKQLAEIIRFAHKMRFIILISSIFVALTAVHGSFINPYPRFKSFSDGGNPGDALYLTEYIEKGDIETVKFCCVFPFILLVYSNDL